MPKQKTVFVCTDCGNETSNWGGKCPRCGAWNTLKEITLDSKTGRNRAAAGTAAAGVSRKIPKPLPELDTTEEIRFSTGISEFDRVLGGGAVTGSLVLVGGAPGIGKSTILLQMCGKMNGSTVGNVDGSPVGNVDGSAAKKTYAGANGTHGVGAAGNTYAGYADGSSDSNTGGNPVSETKILYISGEESERQLKLRATRLGVNSKNVLVLSETDISAVLQSMDETEPDVVIIDSIQTISDYESDSAPGSVTQVRECTMRIMRMAKEHGITVFIVGHINKEGSIAGPKVLEHMVDCVLYFEGEQNTSFRLLRAVKNRFGSTNEIGIFEMNDSGLECVENPSEMLLSGRPENTPGTCVTCILEGSRPILAEVQALVSPVTAYNPSRRCNGLDYNRAAMLLAVTEKRGGLAVSGCDAYINVIGGLTLDEPAADLATVLAISSSYLDRPLGTDLAALGEVGLSGEIRSVSSINQRLSEIARLGFKRCVIPAHIRGEVKHFAGLELVPVKNVREAVRAVVKG